MASPPSRLEKFCRSHSKSLSEVLFSKDFQTCWEEVQASSVIRISERLNQDGWGALMKILDEADVSGLKHLFLPMSFDPHEPGVEYSQHEDNDMVELARLLKTGRFSALETLYVETTHFDASGNSMSYASRDGSILALAEALHTPGALRNLHSLWIPNCDCIPIIKAVAEGDFQLHLFSVSDRIKNTHYFDPWRQEKQVADNLERISKSGRFLNLKYLELTYGALGGAVGFHVLVAAVKSGRVPALRVLQMRGNRFGTLPEMDLADLVEGSWFRSLTCLGIDDCNILAKDMMRLVDKIIRKKDALELIALEIGENPMESIGIDAILRLANANSLPHLEDLNLGSFKWDKYKTKETRDRFFELVMAFERGHLPRLQKLHCRENRGNIKQGSGRGHSYGTHSMQYGFKVAHIYIEGKDWQLLTEKKNSLHHFDRDEDHNNKKKGFFGRLKKLTHHEVSHQHSHSSRASSFSNSSSWGSGSELGSFSHTGSFSTHQTGDETPAFSRDSMGSVSESGPETRALPRMTTDFRTLDVAPATPSCWDRPVELRSRGLNDSVGSSIGSSYEYPSNLVHAAPTTSSYWDSGFEKSSRELNDNVGSARESSSSSSYPPSKIYSQHNSQHNGTASFTTRALPANITDSSYDKVIKSSSTSQHNGTVSFTTRALPPDITDSSYDKVIKTSSAGDQNFMTELKNLMERLGLVTSLEISEQGVRLESFMSLADLHDRQESAQRAYNLLKQDVANMGLLDPHAVRDLEEAGSSSNPSPGSGGNEGITREFIREEITKVIDTVHSDGDLTRTGLIDMKKELSEALKDTQLKQDLLVKHVQALQSYSVEEKEHCVPRYLYLAKRGKPNMWITMKEAFQTAFQMHLLCEARFEDGLIHEVQNQEGFEIKDFKRWLKKIEPWLRWSLAIAVVVARIAGGVVLPGLGVIIPNFNGETQSLAALVTTATSAATSLGDELGEGQPAVVNEGKVSRADAPMNLKERTIAEAIVGDLLRKKGQHEFALKIGLRKVLLSERDLPLSGQVKSSVAWICEVCLQKYGDKATDITTWF